MCSQPAFPGGRESPADVGEQDLQRAHQREHARGHAYPTALHIQVGYLSKRFSDKSSSSFCSSRQSHWNLKVIELSETVLEVMDQIDQEDMENMKLY